MRYLLTVVLTGITFCLIACGNQDKTEDAQPQAEAPKVDLHSAVVSENLAVIRQHITAGSDINVLEPSRASTPLITAAALGKQEAARLLIEAGADLNYQNADGSTALHTAAAFGRDDLAEMLIDAGTDLNIQNNDGSSALHIAAFLCREEIVQTLLDKGADQTLKNGSGKTAYEIVSGPFEDLEVVYDAVGAALKPLGVQLDYERIRKTRPRIAQMLK